MFYFTVQKHFRTLSNVCDGADLQKPLTIVGGKLHHRRLTVCLIRLSCCCDLYFHRSSRSEVICKKGILKDFAKCREKTCTEVSQICLSEFRKFFSQFLFSRTPANNSFWKWLLKIFNRYLSSLIYSTSARLGRHRCERNATRVRHKWDTSATRLKSFDFDNDASDENIFSHPYLSYMENGNYKESKNYILRTTSWKCLFIMRLLNLVMANGSTNLTSLANRINVCRTFLKLTMQIYL